MPRSLPDFQKPPLTEVVLGVQFEPIAGFGSIHAGLFWNRIRKSFPEVEERPALQPVIERFGGRPPRDLKVQWEVVTAPPPTRYWFLNQKGDQLVQLQPDRFLHNWRKQGLDDAYPRYERIRAAFSDELDLFLAFLRDEGLSEPEPNQCEDGDGLWRRIPPRHFVMDENRGAYRPSSAAFEDHPSGTPMSIHVAKDAFAEGYEPEDALRGHEGYALVVVAAGAARAVKQGVAREPAAGGDRTRSRLRQEDA